MEYRQKEKEEKSIFVVFKKLRKKDGNITRNYVGVIMEEEMKSKVVEVIDGIVKIKLVSFTGVV